MVNLACNTEVYPFKDNEASRLKANEAKANKSKLKEDKTKEEEQRKKDEEGEERGYKPGRHMPQQVLLISGMRSGWRCMPVHVINKGQT